MITSKNFGRILKKKLKKFVIYFSRRYQSLFELDKSVVPNEKNLGSLHVIT